MTELKSESAPPKSKPFVVGLFESKNNIDRSRIVRFPAPILVLNPKNGESKINFFDYVPPNAVSVYVAVRFGSTPTICGFLHLEKGEPIIVNYQTPSTEPDARLDLIGYVLGGEQEESEAVKHA